MPKKPKDDVPNPNSVSNRDIIQRLNFLYQASVYLNGMQPMPSHSPSISASGNANEDWAKGKRKRKGRRVLSTSDLSRSYAKTMKAVGQKSVTKM